MASLGNRSTSHNFLRHMRSDTKSNFKNQSGLKGPIAAIEGSGRSLYWPGFSDSRGRKELNILHVLSKCGVLNHLQAICSQGFQKQDAFPSVHSSFESA
jgi:hypothetical protein